MRTRHFAAALALALLAMPALAAITGSIMTVDGAPVAGARVSFFTSETPEARRGRLLSQSPQRTPAESTQTDAKGAFSLPSPKDAVVELRVEATGYEPLVRRVERDEDAGAITLTKRETRKGTIAAGGKPVANATVVLNFDGADFIARTDEQGRYDAPDPKLARRITVFHPDYAIDDEVFVRTTTPASELNRTLTAGAKIGGRVVAADGTTPVANATILVDQWPLATTSEDGSFTVPHAAKWSSLIARKDALLAQRSADSPVKGALVMKMEKAATVAGRITDAKTKLPIAGAAINLGTARRMMLSDGFAMATYTDAKGGYSLTVPAGAYSVFVSHPAFDFDNAEITVTAGQQAVRDIAMNQLARVSGVVVNEEQKPVVAATITAEQADATNPMRMMSRMFRSFSRAASGPDGRFSIRLSADQDLRLAARKAGLPSVKGETLHLAAGERKTGVVLLMPAGIAVTGRVKDANGAPLSGVSVVASDTPSGGRGGMMVRQFAMFGGPGEEEDTVRTASDGTFTLRVQEGTYDFTFRREGYAAKAVRAQSVTPRGVPPIETTLEPAVEIAGRVTRGGVGLADVNISSFAMGGDNASTVSGPDGAFTLGGLAPGTSRLMIRKEADFIQDQRTVSAPARDVVFDYPTGGRVQGRVVEKGSNKPIASFQAGISTSRGGGGFVMMAPPQLKAFTSEDGSFVLENVPAGAMNIVAQAPGYSNGRVNVDVEEGKTVSDVVLELDLGVHLTGKVTGPNGAALSDASVSLQPSPTGQFARSGSVRRATTDSNGEFTLDSLDPGEETFEISHPKFLSTTKTVTLKGRDMRMDVQLSGGQHVTGVVVTADGMPVADAEVEAFTASGMDGDSVRTNASGQFEFPSLGNARYRFVASKTGYLEGTLEDVDASSGTNLRIQLRTGGTIYGRVTGLSEQELSGASVMARSGRTMSTAAIDPAGNFRVEGAPIGSVQVSAQAGSRTFTERRSSGTQTVEVAAGSAVQVNLEFRNDTYVRGRVLRNGAPLGGAMVMFQPRGGSRAGGSSTADEAGNYTVSGLEEGEYSVIVTDAQRFSPYQTTFQVRTGPSTFDIDYKIGSVRGRVIDAGTNEPIEDASVNFRPTSGEMRFPRGAMTDPNGNFSLDALPPGTYTVTANAKDYGTDVREEPFGEAGRDGFEIRLSRNDGVKLHVVDARNGQPINASVSVYDAAGRVVHETAMRFGNTAPGETELRLAPGTYTATVGGITGYATQSVRVTSPSPQPITVGLTPGGTILLQSKHSTVRQMRILDASGYPYPRFSSRPPMRDLLPGTVPMDNVATGSYTLQLLNDDGSIADTVSVVVREGETTRVTL
jgi:uncharacterized GH25 family protein